MLNNFDALTHKHSGDIIYILLSQNYRVENKAFLRKNLSSSGPLNPEHRPQVGFIGSKYVSLYSINKGEIIYISTQGLHPKIVITCIQKFKLDRGKRSINITVRIKKLTQPQRRQNTQGISTQSGTSIQSDIKLKNNKPWNYLIPLVRNH
jgi:hypothetical protein